MKSFSTLRLFLSVLVIAGALSATVSAQTVEFWADSLSAKGAKDAKAENSLQYYLDSLGYDIDVAHDELGMETFCGLPGVNTATMVIEVAGSAVYAASGYYKAGDTSHFYQLFGPSNDPGDSVQFNFPTGTSFGFYMKPNLPGQMYTWVTQHMINSDHFDHAWVFATGVPHEYLICWEDLPNGGDADYQDLVIRVRFANSAPVVSFSIPDTTITACSLGEICFGITATDPNCQADSIWLTMLEGQGSFTEVAGVTTINATHCFTPTASGTYRFVFRTEDVMGAIDIDTLTFTIDLGQAPMVEVPDSTVFLCEPSEICLPIEVLDPDCDVVSVTTNMGSYSGTQAGFDQLSRINQLGGTITQIGGGDPGKVLTAASDFVAPVNSQSGVNVTLPNFVFSDHIVSAGTFPTGVEPGNSATHLLYAPTDLTFTLPGAGGPDGGSGDGSVSFSSGNNCVLGFPQLVSTCNGANVDFVVFTDGDGGGGTAQLKFRKNGTVVHTITRTLPGGAASSGAGGVTFDLPDGLTFNEIYIKCTGGSFKVDAFAARTEPSPTTEDVCFTADEAGVYEVIVTATDACNNVVADTGVVTVAMNHAPVADAGTNQNFFACQFYQICLPVGFSDPDNNITLTEKTSGPGTLNGGLICFTPASEGVYTFVIHVEDACGLEDYDTVVVNVDTNDRPVAVDPSPVNVFQCTPQELCYNMSADDPNGGTLTWSHLAGVGTITPQGNFCFTPTASGTHGAALVVTDSCGAADTTSFVIVAVLNTAPVAVDPPGPLAVSQCTPQEICYQFNVNDAQGGPLVWSLLSGPGTITPAGRWCFTPTASGDYIGRVVVTDSCGLADTTSKTFNVTVNGAPTIAFGADSSLSLCQPQQVCLNYTVSDPQGATGLIEELVSGYGTLDTLANKVCFTPTTAGTYEFVVRVKDDCQAMDYDTVVVNVTFGQFADITCPTEPINVSLCAVDTVCQQLTITPSTASVSVSFGTFGDGQLCFPADTSGTYNIRVIAAGDCSSDTCMVTFNVNIGQAAQIDCPAAQNVFLCQADTVCIPVGVVGSGAIVTVSPVGTYQAGGLCFPADTAGHYTIQMIASTTCGTDTCVVVADVVINHRPVIADPATPVDTFLCTAGQICRQFGATDTDGGALTWSRLTGNGTVTSSGQWCFAANSDGTYSVTVAVTDSCGAADTTTLTYNVGVNVAPVFAFSADTTAFLCGSGQVCVPFTLSDANNNLTSIELTEGTGTIFTSNNLLCFTAQHPGAYRFIARATDACNAQVTDTIVVTVTFNTAPVVDAGPSLTRFQCAATEICWPVSATDVDGNLASVQLVTGPGAYTGSQICFTPTGTLDYEFVLKATDACGAEDWDTVVIRYTLNNAPVAAAGNDTTLFLCSTQPVCWAASCSDIDGNLTSGALVSGPGTYDGGSICFSPSASGAYTFVLQASDACGETDLDTVVANVTINSTPVCHVPNDTLIFQCDPAPVCLPVFGEDADGNLDHCEIVSGQGTLSGGTWCYTPVASQSVTVVVRCIDDCGAQCESQFTVEFEINQAPTIAFGSDFSVFQCVPEDICIPFAVADENDPRTRTIILVEGGGIVDENNSELCFTPFDGGGDDKDITEEYTFIIRVEDECGEFDEDTITVSVTLNSPPAANAGADLALFVCAADTTICWPASCTDPDDNLADCLFNGPGAYDGSQMCFSPATSGSYLFTLQAIDECGEETVDSVVIDITLNSAPTMAFGADSALHLCQPQQVCVEYAANDADGLTGLVETLVSGYGTFDSVTNQVCFTPTAAGSYETVVRVTDPCGAYAEDTIVVNVTFGEYAEIECPTAPLNISLCAVETVCQTIAISPADAEVTVSYGTYADGQLCFLADTSGVYSIQMIAEADCGSDTCEMIFNVSIGSAAQLSCPEPFERFLCTPGNICFPIGVMGTGVNVTVSPIGTYTRGDVCFPADTTGHYELTIIAETPCGADTCVAVIDVTLNSAPVAVDPPAVDTFLCASAQICGQFAASDADGGTLTWSRISGSGTVTADGLWCFTASAAGTYTVTARVADACGATDQITATYNVTMNAKPTVTLGIDTLIAQCQAQEICLPYQVTDPNSNVVLEEIFPVEYAAGLNTELNQFCFTPTVAGPIKFIIRATDACGAVDEDTINVAVMFNHAPVANAGADVNVFQCQSTQICIPAGCTDSDNNLVNCAEITGTASYNGSSLCFTPTASGVYTMILRAEDACGAIDEDTVVATVRINSAPSCQLPDGTTRFFQCQPTAVSLPVGAADVDGNFDHCEIVRGPGSISGGQWTYTPTADQTVTVAIMCLDQCGASCIDSFTVAFDINSKPVANAGVDKTFFLCSTGQVCWDAGCSDVDGNLANCEILSPAGAVLQGSQICMNVDFGSGTDRVFNVVVKATDSCDATDLDSATVRVNFNQPPTIALPPNFVAYLESVGELCFSAGITDEDGNLANVTVSPLGVYNPATGQICFDADSTGTYCFEISATDQCGAQSVDSVCIEVQIDECVHVQIAKVHDAIQGQHKMVDIYLNGSGHELGGYDFLIYYDPTALTPSEVLPGDLLATCGWEYFNYRFGPDGNCGNGCPSSLLRIVGMAESNNGAYHPGCFLDGLTGSLATIDFLVSNDRNLECQYAPVRFFWNDCGDNVFSSRNGDTLWVSRTVYDFELNNITNVSHGFPGYVGAPDWCLAGEFEGKPVPIRCVDLTNGGVDIICADSIDARGDINLNGLAHEIADAVMFTNYFVVGLSAFDHPDGSTAASDVNGDGLPLTVADLVYLIRVVVGDAPAVPKVAPGQFEQVDFARTGDLLTITKSATRIGAIFIVLEGDAKPILAESATNMEMRYHFDGTDTRVLIYNMNGKTFVESGAVLNINGSNTVKTVEVGGYDGQVVQAKLTSVPKSFALSQNYPNPFNPVTTIEYALPIAGKWSLTVYNVLGQEVETWSGESDPGYYKVEWDAGRYASGVYLYRLMAGEFSATKKMVLLK